MLSRSCFGSASGTELYPGIADCVCLLSEQRQLAQCTAASRPILETHGTKTDLKGSPGPHVELELSLTAADTLYVIFCALEDAQ